MVQRFDSLERFTNFNLSIVINVYIVTVQIAMADVEIFMYINQSVYYLHFR